MPSEPAETLLTKLLEAKEYFKDREKHVELMKDDTQKYSAENTLESINTAKALNDKMATFLELAEMVARSHGDCAEKEEELRVIQDLRNIYARIHEKITKILRDQCSEW
jgi:hypothetical protein